MQNPASPSTRRLSILYIEPVDLYTADLSTADPGERGGSVVECRTPEREVRGSRPTAAVLCPWARHFTPRKYWLITQEAMAPSRYDWKIVDWDVKPQHNQPTNCRPVYLILSICRPPTCLPSNGLPISLYLLTANLLTCLLLIMQYLSTARPVCLFFCIYSVYPRSQKGYGKVFVKQGIFTWKGHFYSCAPILRPFCNGALLHQELYWCMVYPAILSFLPPFLQPRSFLLPPVISSSPSPLFSGEAVYMHWYNH